MQPTLVFQLPELPDRDHADSHWWLIGDDGVIDRGVGSEWTGLLVDGAGSRQRQIALAPAGAVRVVRTSPKPNVPPRQAEAIARLAAAEAALADPQTLHVVSAANADGQSITSAVVDNGAMLGWLDWAAHFGASPEAIIPVAAVLEPSENWSEATIGDQHLLVRRDVVFPAEPALAAAIADTSEIETVDKADIEVALGRVAMAPPLNMRSGRFARRRRLLIDKGRIRELAALAAAAMLLGLLWGMVNLLKLERSTARLDDETIAIAEAALGGPVSITNAETELRARIGGSGHGGFQPSLAALYSVIQADSAISSTDMGYRNDGTLSVTLAAAAVDNINRSLVALQRDGYRVTAVPRQAPDGRAMVDVTIRSAP